MLSFAKVGRDVGVSWVMASWGVGAVGGGGLYSSAEVTGVTGEGDSGAWEICYNSIDGLC